MSTYTQIIYQIVFSTKDREHTLVKPNRAELYKYIFGIHKNKNCHLYRINGIEDHLHIITHLHPSISLSSLIKDIKLASSEYIKKSELFPKFRGWQGTERKENVQRTFLAKRQPAGRGAFTYSIKEKDKLIEYVKRQEEHHTIKTFREEYIEILNEQEIAFEEKYLL